MPEPGSRSTNSRFAGWRFFPTSAAPSQPLVWASGPDLLPPPPPPPPVR